MKLWDQNSLYNLTLLMVVVITTWFEVKFFNRFGEVPTVISVVSIIGVLTIGHFRDIR